MQLWEELKQPYKNKAEKYCIDEFIFALNYDFAVMPYQSDNNDLGFYKWIFLVISKST